jgi:hypothetical protein
LSTTLDGRVPRPSSVILDVTVGAKSTRGKGYAAGGAVDHRRRGFNARAPNSPALNPMPIVCNMYANNP